jgi:apolipoprotein N-acyltransferase
LSILSKIGRFFLPADISLRKRRLELTVWAFLLSLAYYPGYLGFLAWFSLVRPFIIISRLKGREAFNASYFFGFFFNAFSLYWVGLVTPPGMIMAIVIVAFYYTAVLCLFNVIYRWKPLAGFVSLPFLWVGMEYFRTLSQFAFPWSDLGYTQSYYLYILQIVSVISVHGLSFLIVTVNVLLWQVLRKELLPERRLTSAYFAVGIVVALVAFGWAVMPKYPKPGTLPIALLQGSVPVDIKWELENEGYSIKRYDSLTQTIHDTATGLVIWPESAAPCYLSNDVYCRQEVAAIARKSHMYHLVGALGITIKDTVRHYYNSCYQFSPQGVMQERYDKMKLVPFSEQAPYQDYLPILKRDVLTKYLTLIDRYNVQWWSDFYPGDSIRLFSLPQADYGVLICFESTFPDFVRAMILKGADFVVGITNDTWFGGSVGIYMHSRIFVTRAVENRCWMARAANSGLTYIVDGYGRIRESLPLNAVTVLKGKIGFLDGFSIFTRYGDIAGRFSFLVTASLVLILFGIWLLRKLFFRS